jgi:hypothetical protein
MALAAATPLESLLQAIERFVQVPSLELTPAELGEHLVRLRHGIDLLELGFTTGAAGFAATDEYDAQGSVSPIDWIRLATCPATPLPERSPPGSRWAGSRAVSPRWMRARSASPTSRSLRGSPAPSAPNRAWPASMPQCPGPARPPRAHLRGDRRRPRAAGAEPRRPGGAAGSLGWVRVAGLRPPGGVHQRPPSGALGQRRRDRRGQPRQSLIHPPRLAEWSRSRARFTRDMTVPIGMPSSATICCPHG